ncbi:MAG: ATP-binding cassette domain-containing protein [Gemmatimonadetes bacterium]|nr:ATP-binding cassette domain-containing protein [Gemmatimonadota bacterium]MCH7489313.1 ATP-binding cassette domain-containing protein [Gemmatimonadota bacterium]
MSTPAVNCKGLVKRYGDVVAVDGLDLEIRVGECFGLLGPNGAGKTTTVEILQGLLPPDAGSVEVLGMRWENQERSLRERMGTQLQDTQLPDKLSVVEVLTLFRSFYRAGKPVEDVIDMVQLREKRDVWVKNLSGGQRQRLSVACSLVSDPEILFLDEPTTGLDPQSRHQLWRIIGDFRAGGGTILLTTHHMEEAERLCDRVAVIDHGKVIAQGSPRALIESLGAEHVVQFALANGDSIDHATLGSLPGVERVSAVDGRTQLTVMHVHEAVPALMTLLQQRRAELSELTTHHATLEDVFISLTGRHLRDG